MTEEAIFLSASVPGPNADPKYRDSADVIAIAAAVSALVTLTLGRRLLVWGGHPAITPMIWATAEHLGVDYGKWVHLFQSRFFQDVYPLENARFRNVTYVDAVDGNRDQSLENMRREMLKAYSYQSAVFIGGMKGVEDECEMFREAFPNKPIFPIASTGGAARLIYLNTPDLPSELADSLGYAGYLPRLLAISPREKRR